jgi:hypothetical protein
VAGLREMARGDKARTIAPPTTVGRYMRLLGGTYKCVVGWRRKKQEEEDVPSIGFQPKSEENRLKFRHK